MNSFFRKLTLPAKLSVLGGLPLLFLLVVAFQYNQEKTDKLRILDGYRQRTRQVITINNLISALQSERRFSFGYNLKGAFQNEMLQQRSLVDEALNTLNREAAVTLPGLASYTFIDQLAETRNRIDNKDIQPLGVMNFYTNIIFRLGSLTTVTAGSNVYLQPINQDVVGQKLLSDVVTYKGIVLSQIYLMLETKKSEPQLISSALQLDDIIKTYLKEFALKAAPERAAAFNKLKQDFDVKAADDILGKIRATNSLDTSISSDFWWNVSTKAVDEYKTLQQQLIMASLSGAEAIYNKEKRAQTWSYFILAAAFTLVIITILTAIRLINQSLGRLRHAASQIAGGKSVPDLVPESPDVVGLLTQSIAQIDRNSQQLAKAAQAIGEGRFDVAVQPRSGDDVLGNAVVQMKQNLENFRQASDEKLWIQEGIANVNDSIRGYKSVKAISGDALQALAIYLDCAGGLFYSAQDEVLVMQAAYAASSLQNVPQQLAFGETLIGQVALDKKPLHLDNSADTLFEIRSGLGTARPQSVLLVPLLMDDAVEGVLELASLERMPAYKVLFVTEVASALAIALQAARNREQLQELYEQTQAQAEELQTQHSELENINAELEAQAEKLKASEEELKVQQEELLQANRELEERSRILEERNQLIVEKNLDIQQKVEELAASTKYKSEFLANMSHELRTPLNSVLLLSRLLTENNEKNLSTEQIEYARVIQSSGQGLLSLIDEILDLSKIEAGKMELEYGPVALQEIVQDMQQLFAPIAKEKGLEFKLETANNLPSRIDTDKLRLEQVLRNLLSNALKFTSQGSVQLCIEAVNNRESFLAFRVKDTGIGISPEKQALIFEAFQQADGSTRRRFGGTGLGLSISRELAQLLGGEIKVVSEPGKGSEFTVYVPVNKATAQQKATDTKVNNGVAPKTEESPLPALPARGYRTTKIPDSLPDDRHQVAATDKVLLIIEDDTAFAKALLDFARQKGYKALVAVRGDEGIELAQQYRPAGILLDIQLPVKDGWEVMDELKANSATRHIPVHTMSSLEAKRESLLKGAVDFISKPVAFEQLQTVFRKIEQVVSKEHKKVLIVEENPKHAEALSYFLQNFRINTEISSSVSGGADALKKDDVDCVILDMGIPDPQAYETLEKLKQRPGMESLPIIIFTGKSLSQSEEQRIKQYADSIVIKTAHSYQRIIDEVSLFLHLVEENNNNENLPASRYKRLGALNEVLSGKKILVVDDDVRNIFSLTKALEVYGMQVVTAVDGKEALRQLEENSDTEVVLMDIMMPEMDGYEAMQHIRKKAAFRNLPIIAVTAKAMSGDREKCIQAGASDYISKPVDIDQLLSLLRVWLYE